MNDQSIEPQARGTVFFGRKVSDGNYGGTEAAIHVQFDLAVDDPSQTLNNINDAYATAKDAVLNQLSIVHYWDGDAQMVKEAASPIIEKAAVAQVAKAFSAEPSGAVPRPDNGDGPSCPECNGAMWDNREGKKNPRQPDYRCKASNQGCNGVIWPERKRG